MDGVRVTGLHLHQSSRRLSAFRRQSTRLSTDMFSSSRADVLCEEAFELLDNIEDVLCYTEPLSNGERSIEYICKREDAEGERGC